MATEIEARVRAVFQAVFDDPDLTIGNETTANDVEGWDSLSHIDLIVAVEREFKIRFTTAEVTGMKNVGDLIGLVAQKMR
jgi:acyl carrier protein